jgi:pyrroline-5-carboxylate reductase
VKPTVPVDLKSKQVRILGTGNMGEALLRGLLKSEAVLAEHIMVTSRRDERLEALAATYNVRASDDNAHACDEADVVILAVKPQVLDCLLQQIAQSLPSHTLVISIAAGVSTAGIEAHLRPGTHVCRAMPNTPAIVGAGATAVAPGRFATAEDMRVASAVFRAVGTVTQVDETLLDAVTGLSGSGPAYVFLIIEALADAGVKVGLPRYQALELAAQTMLGSAKLLLETGQHPGVLKDQVTSPGGTAIAGLHTLEQGGLRTTLINAVVTATARSRELGALSSKKT